MTLKYLRATVLYLLIALFAHQLHQHYVTSNTTVTVADVFGVVALFSLIPITYYFMKFVLNLVTPTRVQYIDSNNTVRTAYASTLKQEVLKDIENTARHEAAHAVAVLASGLTVTNVSTVPDIFKARGGNCEWSAPREGSIENYMNYMTISLAGDIAAPHEEFSGSVGMSQGSDYQNALGAAMRIAVLDNEYTTTTALDEGMQRARTIVEQNKDAIEHLASNLVMQKKNGELKPKSMSEEEITECLKDYEIVSI